MPNIKETIEIIKATPIDQATMLVGGHGIGKSQCISQIFLDNGYRIVTLFVGQMADAGDFTGLPDRVPCTVKWKDAEGGTHEENYTITDYCPPKWWPFDPTEKVLIFLDEVNRGKPEIMQCLMDMVLNRKLNGRQLPEHTRVVAAINPSNTGYYQVEQLDRAFLDRFNVYDFLPSVEEWIYYAAKSNFFKPLVNFIANNDTFLDPPKTTDDEGGDAEANGDQVLPSRRSWERVSDFMKKNPNVKADLMKNYLFGVVGIGATSSFQGFLETVDKGINPGSLITAWDDKIADIISKYNIAQVIFMNGSIARWFDSQNDILSVAPGMMRTYVDNLAKYLEVIKPDAMAHFWGELSNAQKERKEWPMALINADPTESLARRYQEVRNGIKEEEEQSWE